MPIARMLEAIKFDSYPLSFGFCLRVFKMAIELTYEGIQFTGCLVKLNLIVLLPFDFESSRKLQEHEKDILLLVQEELGKEVKGVLFYRLA